MNLRKLKIAFVVVKNIARGGGIEKYTFELGRRLVERGHEVTVFSMKNYGEVPKEYHGMRIVGIPTLQHSALEKLSSSALAALHLLFYPGGFDIVHCHSVAAGAFAPLVRLRGGKCLLQMHGIEWQRSRWGGGGRNLLRFLEYVSLAGNQAHTAVSKTQCDYYKTRAVTMRYIPTGAELKQHQDAQEIIGWGLQPGRYVLFASRLVREKGAHYLIPAFQQLNTDCKLVIAGDAKGEDGYKKELLALAKNDPRILFPGFVGGRELEELFCNAAVYVQPSEIEGLSIALLEAMSYGNCCLVSDIPENVEAIGPAGFTFRNKDIPDLQGKLDDLLSSESLRASVKECARARVAQSYNWDAITSEFEEMYRNLAA